MISVLFRQLLVMFLYMAIGFFLFKKGLITRTGSKELGSLLLYTILPCVIINAYHLELTVEKITGLALSFLFALLALGLAMLLSGLIFGNRHRIENFGAAFSNAGFMGIPLIKAVLGADAVFYVSSFVALLNILQWTYGVMIMTGSKDSIRLKKIIANPILVSFVIGIAVFLLRIPLPEVVWTTINSISGMNGPVAMIILGVYLAQLDFKSLVSDKYAYFCSAVRLLLIPAATIFLMKLLPASYSDMQLAILIAAAAPVGANVAIFAQQNNLSYTDAVKSVCLSTVISLGSMPAILALANLIL